MRRRSTLAADLRVFLLKRKGGEISVTSRKHFATVIVFHDRTNCRHAVTLRPPDLTEEIRRSAAYRRYPQSVLVAQAIHAALDLAEEEHQ